MTSDIPSSRDPAVGHPTDSSESADLMTVLPLARTAGSQPSTLILINDTDQETDHGRRPIPPVTSGGMPYRYKVRLNGANAYAGTADEVLALFIDNYVAQPQLDRNTEMAQIRRRGEHCLGVIVTHVAHAMFAGHLAENETAVLQRSAEFGPEPLTADDCPRWNNADVPLVLMGDLYAPEYGKFDPPNGNVILLWPGRSERYLSGLAGMGLIALTENPAVAATPLVELRSPDRQIQGGPPNANEGTDDESQGGGA